MKQLSSIITAGLLCGAIGASAQQIDNRFYLGLNLKAGAVNEYLVMKTVNRNYSSALNFVTGDKDGRITIDNGAVYGGEVKVGYYFSPDKHWGIGTGITYTTYSGTKTTDSIHLEYQSSDFKNDVFRQVISSTAPIQEEYTTTNISLPLMFNYKTNFKGKLGLQIDAGILYNLSITSEYTTRASFNYEAIYKFEDVNGQSVAVYDNSPVPSPSSWLLTVDQYKRGRGDGGEQAYFETLRAQGYNVGLNKEATRKSGTVNYKTGSIGLVLQPSMTYKVGNSVMLNIGGYLMYQTFNNTDENKNMKIADQMGTYNPYWHNALKSIQTNYGVNLGATFFLF